MNKHGFCNFYLRTSFKKGIFFNNKTLIFKKYNKSIHLYGTLISHISDSIPIPLNILLTFMLQQSSPIPQDELEEAEFNPSWPIQDIQNNANSSNSPSVLCLQQPSRRSLKIKSRSSIRSRTDLIKISKITPHQQNSQKNKQIECVSITGSSPRQCRICLEGESQGRLVRPCRCIGSMQYAHQKCLSEWIKRKLNMKQKGKVHCEVCDEAFEYKICKRLSVSCEMMKENFSRHRSNYICFIIVMAVMLLMWMMILSLTCMGMSSEDNWVKKNIMGMNQTRIIFIAVVIVYMLIMVFVILLFVAEYGIKTEMIVKNLRNHNKTFRKVVPKLYMIAM